MSGCGADAAELAARNERFRNCRDTALPQHPQIDIVGVHVIGEACRRLDERKGRRDGYSSGDTGLH